MLLSWKRCYVSHVAQLRSNSRACETWERKTRDREWETCDNRVTRRFTRSAEAAFAPCTSTCQSGTYRRHASRL